MKNLGKKVRSIGTAFLLAGVATAYGATITNSAGSFANFGGFDWAGNGTAVVDGYDASITVGESDDFDLTFWASAAQIVNTSGQGGVGSGFAVANAGILAGSYEYTIRVLLNETATCTAFDVFCTAADFAINSGSFEIWYDPAPINANQVTGAGITDGFLLITGTIFAQAGGGFDIITGGNATLQAQVTSTNAAFITPALDTSTATTTLQIGANVTNWDAPTSMPGAAGGTMALPEGAILLQADANQSFTSRVPEPGTIALAGLALLGLGLTRLRSKRA